MRRNSKYIVSLIVMVALVAPFQLSVAQAQGPAARTIYQVISASPTEITVRIHPDFTTQTVTDPVTKDRYLDIQFSGATNGSLRPGVPAEQYLDLGMLVPNASATPSIEIVSMQTEQMIGVLAPVPTSTLIDGQAQLRFIRRPEAYGTRDLVPYASARAPIVMRTAWRSSLVIHPIRYELDNSTITLVKDMVVRIHIPASDMKQPHAFSSQESQYFETMCINGDNTSLYRSATAQLAVGLPTNSRSMKQNAPTAAEQWFTVATSDEGVYRVSADDLVKAGATSIDPATIAVYGYGAQQLPEGVDSATGELHECNIDVVTKGDGSLSEVRFYAPGPSKWAYESNAGSTRLYGFYHVMNPYSTTGHLLLKVGGATTSKRIETTPDVISDTAPVVTAANVQTVAVHEAELRYEHPNISREFLGEAIPVGRDVSVSLPSLPGYLPDSTVVRPGFNSRAHAKHDFFVSINGTSLGSVTDYGTVSDEGPYTTRRWDQEFVLPQAFSTPNTITLQASSSEISASFWLNFVEVFYRRTLSLSNGQIPFYLIGDASVYRYNFSDASSGGEVWDVSDPLSVRRLGQTAGSTLSVTIAGGAKSMRRFYAFNPSQLKGATLSAISTPSLRNTVCTEGAQEIIIVPNSMMEQAQKLATIRRQGGQATDPISVTVVSLEDIYREFGYGNNDVTAIRDFVRCAVRRTAVAGTTVPLYICLFGGGHTDYQNRLTQLPVNIPVYETWDSYSVNSMRASEPADIDSDDGFFVTFNSSPNNAVDMAIGRIAVLDATEAEDYIAKVVKYETSSDEGPWRARMSFIADDRYHVGLAVADGLDHFHDTENEVAQTPDRYNFQKIYGAAYPNIFTAAGRRKPEMESAIVDAFNNGASIISYVGHGNPTIWADEGILTVPSTINKFTNFNRLAYVTTATCDFSQFDDYAAKISGGVQMMKKPDGGAIGLLATCRSVAGGDSFAPQFYRSLFSTPCDSRLSTTPVGLSYVYARATSSYTPNRSKYFLLGDPAQRVLLPRQYVTIDSINGVAYNEKDANEISLKALSLVSIAGHIAWTCDGSDFDQTFNGTTTVTLFDAPSYVSYTTTFIDSPPITDSWKVDGPILYTGAASVTDGRFHTSFVVSKDIKFDTTNAKFSMLAYSDDHRSALGTAKNLRVYGIDTARIDADHNGPALTLYIGTRAFHSGDVVPANTRMIVDVKDLSGLNTSTSSIGHSFVGWVDDSTSGMIDLASGYVASSNDFTNGTSTEAVTLPLGRHRLNVRAFDAAGNPAFASVEFEAKGDAPYKLFDVTIRPHPVHSTATFTFQQPASTDSPVDVSLDIFTSIGQHVRSITVPSISSNVIEIPFDAKADNGQSLSDGMYVYRLTTTQRLSGVTTTSGGTFIIVRDH